MPFIDNDATGTRWHTCHRELRWSDFDQYQHVNNAKYLEFGQDARMVFLKDVLMEMDIAVPPFFVRYTTIDYPRPLSPGEAEVAVSSFFTRSAASPAPCAKKCGTPSARLRAPSTPSWSALT